MILLYLARIQCQADTRTGRQLQVAVFDHRFFIRDVVFGVDEAGKFMRMRRGVSAGEMRRGDAADFMAI